MKRLWRRLVGRRRPEPPWPRLDAETERFALRLPKVDLHVPLECSLRPATVLALAQRAGRDLGVESESQLRGVLVPRDRDGWRAMRRQLRVLLADPAGIEQALADLVAEMAIQSILHAEVVIPLGPLLAEGLAPEAVADVLDRAGGLAEERGASLAFLLGLDGGSPETIGAALAAGDLGWSGVVLDAPEPGETPELAALGSAGERIVVAADGRPLELRSTTGRSRSPLRIVHAPTAPEETDPVRVRCPAVDRLLGIDVPSSGPVTGPVASAGGPLLATNLTREMLRAVARVEDPRRQLVANARAGIDACFVDAARRDAWRRRLDRR